MTDFDSLRSEIIQLGESTVHAMDAQNRLADLHAQQINALWADNAELRDELLTGLAALSNRIESLSRGLTADPAEVAEKIVERNKYDKHGKRLTEVQQAMRWAKDNRP